MITDDIHGVEPYCHDEEIESLRRDLELMLEVERIRLEQVQAQALCRIEHLSENSLKGAASEWDNYEALLSSARNEFYTKSREEMFHLLATRIQSELQDESIRFALENMLPMIPSKRMVEEN